MSPRLKSSISDTARIAKGVSVTRISVECSLTVRQAGTCCSTLCGSRRLFPDKVREIATCRIPIVYGMNGNSTLLYLQHAMWMKR